MAVSEAISSVVPGGFSIGGSLGGIFSFVAYLIVIIIICVLGGAVTYIIIKRKKYKYTIVIFEIVNGRPEPTKKEKAIEIKYGMGGDTIFLTNKSKRYLPRPTKQTGKNTYWFFVRSDGEWINIEPGDWDEQAKTLGAKFLDKEMRYARTQIQKGLKDRYDKRSWLSEHWTVVMGIGFVAIIGVMTFLLFDKWIELAGTTNQGVEMAGKVMEQAKNILGNLDNICSGGSGIVPAS